MLPFDLEKFVHAAGDGIIAANPDGSIVMWNPAAERIFGYTEKKEAWPVFDLIIPGAFSRAPLARLSVSDEHRANSIWRQRATGSSGA